MKLSIIIPAHNEESRLGSTLASYTGHFVGKYGDNAEVIVVVNASTDATESLVTDFARTCPQVKLVVEPRRVGKGGAVLLGFAKARGALVGFVDADGSTPPEAFQDLVDRIGDAGAIIASRWMKGSQVSPRQPFSRRLASRVFNTAVRLLFKLRIHDTQCGAKLFTREALDEVGPRLGLTRWAFDVGTGSSRSPPSGTTWPGRS
jgi:glycosyltransferase involved in cell wall biosynthesis